MAFFKISKGLEINLPTTKIDGRMYFCTDTGNIYIDYQDGDIIVRKLVDKSKFDELNNYIGSEISNLYTEINNINGTYIGPEPPEDINRLWVDTEDESQEGGYDTEILNSKIDNHNQDVNSHSDIRKVINSLPTKEYVLGVKNDLLNGAGDAYDTLKELGELIDDNTDAIDALEIVATGKADKTHYHTIADISELQTVLDEKAIKVDFDAHSADTTKHITSTERSNWNAAKTTADNAYALAESKVSSLSDLNITATADELNYVDGVTSNIQGQLDEKSRITTKYIDSTTVYTKDVSAESAPYAKVLEIGGMTRKCTNLIPFPYQFNSNQTSGITYTVNDNGSVTYTGTATAQINPYFALNYLLKAGTYQLHGCPQGGDWTKYLLLVQTADYATLLALDFGKGAKFVLEEDTAVNICFVIANGATVSNLTVCPMLNRGTTALPYEPYFDGLRSAPVTEVESVGTNLFDVTKATIYSRIHINSGTVEMLPSSSDQASSDFIFVSPNTKYVINFSYYSTGDYGMAFYNSNKSYISGTKQSSIETSDINIPFVFTTPNNCYYIRFSVGGGKSYNDVSLNKGDIALPYTPYRRNTLPIPAEVQALDGYGWGINADVYNYIDLERKQLVKRVERLDLGTLDWGVLGSLLHAPFPTFKNNSVNALCHLYSPVSYSSQLVDKTFCKDRNGRIYLMDSSYTDAATFKAAMSGVMLYYELTEPVITDISDLLPDNNLIGVEGSGTITLINEHGYDVPNKTEFYKGNNSILGANKFVGDLEGTAATAKTISGLTATIDELNHLDGVTSNIQTQLDGKLNMSSVSATTYVGDLNNAPIGVHWIACSNCTNAPLTNKYGYLEIWGGFQKFTVYNTGETYIRSNVNSTWTNWIQVDTLTDVSNIQTQLDGKIPFDNANAISLKSGDDLDNFKTPGIYISGSSGISSGIINPPTTSSGFKLFVIDGYISGRVSQLATVNNNNLFYRQFNGTSWGDWDTLATKAGLDNKETKDTAATLINRTTAVNAADENYTTYMARGTSLNSAKTSPAANGTIAWTYE